MNTKVNLPYFDLVLEDNSKGLDFLEDSLHMHWGYWNNPKTAVPKNSLDYHNAAEKLCQLIVDQVSLVSGFRLADIGCGFGGTINMVNSKYNGVDMVGLNIDPRQIEIAKRRIKASSSNKIEFIIGNACDLPFENNSIDALTAVECIFHFPDRKKFLSEVSRVLKPGAKFAFSDFVPDKRIRKGFDEKFRRLGRHYISLHYGGGSQTMTLNQYNQAAKEVGLINTCASDVTYNIMPTYKTIFRQIDWRRKGAFQNWFSSKLLWMAQWTKRVNYMILGYQKQ